MPNQESLSGKESNELIQQMINKAKGSYHDSGIGPVLWGSVIAICSMASYAEIQNGFSLPFDILKAVSAIAM
jgi:hypothetical protein